MTPSTTVRYFLPTLRPVHASFTTSLFLAAICGCEEEKPSTPFQVATSLPSQEGAPRRGAGEAPEPPVQRIAQPAPPNAARWEVFDRTLTAPPGTVLQSAIPSLADASEELLVLLAPGSPPDLEASGLWKVDKTGRFTSRILEYPAFLPSGEDCQLHDQLTATGPRSITVALHAECGTRLLPGTATRSIAIVAPHAPSPVLLELRAVEPSPGEELAFQVDSSDLDGDGTDDARIEVTLRAPDGATETLPLVWFARSAGASRQTDEPTETLAKRIARLSLSSVRKAERDQVPSQVSALRRLLASLCAEWGTARLTRKNGDALQCGSLAPPSFQLSQALVQAQLGRGEEMDALGAAERASWYAHVPSAKEYEALAKLLKSKISNQKARQLARFDVAAASLPTAYASPLHFDSYGLWLQGADGKTKRLTMRGDPPLVRSEGGEPPQPVIPPSWELQPSGPGGKRLSAALPSCQRSELQLAFSTPQGTPPAPIPIAVLAPRPGNCRSYAGVTLEAEPLGWAGGHLSFLLGGEVLQSGGHARSFSRRSAWGTHFGLAVHDGSKLNLWTGIPSEGLHHCSASTDLRKVACVKGKSVYVYGPFDDGPGTKAPAE